MFDVKIEKIGEIEILILNGDLNAEASGSFESSFDTITNCFLILDFSSLKYISSAGLRSLVILYENMTRGKGEAVIVSLPPAVREVIEISGFDSLFKIFPSKDSAVAYLSQNKNNK